MDQILEMRTKSSPWGVVVWVMARSVPLFFFLLRKNGWLPVPGKAQPLPCENDHRCLLFFYFFPLVSALPFWSCECERRRRFG